MVEQNRLLRLNPTIEFDQIDGGLIAKVTRGEVATRYTINTVIRDFLEMFREPSSLEDVARLMVDRGLDRDKVMEFGQGIVHTPLLEYFGGDGQKAATIGDFARRMGIEIEHCYKDRKYDGVYRVVRPEGVRGILKIVSLADDDEHAAAVAKRLRNEFEILKALSALPGMPAVLDASFEATPYVLMEFLPGEPLLDRKRNTLRQSLALCAQVAALVDSVHEAGIVHGDIHTSNFLRDDRDRLRMIDFDCSFRADGDYIPRIGGAIHFFPPERAVANWQDRSKAIPNYASDIYQAAVVMYAILSDDLPYRGATFTELSNNILTGKYRPLSKTSLGEEIPAKVIEFIHRCLHAHPECRPADMLEFTNECV